MIEIDHVPLPEFEIGQVVEVVGTNSEDTNHLWRITDLDWVDETFYDYCMVMVDDPEKWTCWGESHLRCSHDPMPEGTCSQCGIWLIPPDERPVYDTESDDY